MSATFIQCNSNQIVQLEKVCSAEYHAFDKEDAELYGATHVLYLRTEDGKEVRLKNNEALQFWTLLQASSINIAPKSAVEKH